MKPTHFIQRALNHLRIAPLLLAAALLFTAAGCGSEEPPAVREVPSDADIKEALRGRFDSSPFLTAGDSIEISVKEGVATLSGSAKNLLAKEKASEIATSAHGVLSVVNNLTVPSTRPDDAVEREVARALATDPATEAWEITPEVSNGFVTLKGRAESWQEKQLAGDIARGVRGVRGVNNTILVNYDPARPAEEVKSEISRLLQFDSRIRSNRIGVSVRGDTVSLAGDVGSAREKQLAMERAHVSGVEAVEADRLEVRPEYESRVFETTPASQLSLEQIREALHRAYAYDPRVPADSITVSFSEGTAVLSGTVEDVSAKLAAADDARNTAGINEVRNNITVQRKVVVKPEVPTSDKAIQNRVMEALRRSPLVDAVPLEATVEKGIVRLVGEADTAFEKQKAAEAAQSVKGVIAVENEITVNSGGPDA